MKWIILIIIIIVSIKFWEKLHEKAYSVFTNIIGDTNDKTLKSLFGLFKFAVYATVLVFLINIFFNSFDKLGEWGDFFGGTLNPLLTFLTFMGLLITIVLQQSELKESRKEFKRSADALFEQSKNTRKQNFENTFFSMIDLHNKIADNIKVDLKELKERTGKLNIAKDMLSNYKVSIMGVTAWSDTDKIIYNGREVFEVILDFLEYNTTSPKIVIKRYKTIQTEKNHILGHYFRNLYQILKTIDKTDNSILSNDEKRKYSSILRAQLSTKELALLCINCLENISDSGQFKNLLIEYSMLEHLLIEKRLNGYSLADSKIAIISKEMLAEYQHKKDFKALDMQKYYGGAFGKNQDIPYNLKVSNKNEEK